MVSFFKDYCFDFKKEIENDFTIGAWKMFDTAWYNENFTFFHLHNFVPKRHDERAFKNHKQFILVFVAMPDKLIFEFAEFYVLAVQLADDMRCPLCLKLGEFLHDIDGLNFLHFLVLIVKFTAKITLLYLEPAKILFFDRLLRNGTFIPVPFLSAKLEPNYSP